MRKADEMEKSQYQFSAIFAFMFYTVSLLALSVYSFVNHGQLGVPFIILIIGMIIFLGSNIILRKRTS